MSERYAHPQAQTQAQPATAVTAAAQAEPTLGALIHDLTTQIPELIRSEIRLAQAEVAEKGKRAGLGLGMFSAAGLLALYGLGTLIAMFVLLLALVVPAWAAALIVAVLLFAGAAVAGLAGKKQVAEATPAKPERAIEGLRADVATLKGEHS